MKNLTGYDNLTAAAELVGVPRSTLKDAIDRGEINTVTMKGSGLVLVVLPSARRWAKTKYKPKGE